MATSTKTGKKKVEEQVEEVPKSRYFSDDDEEIEKGNSYLFTRFLLIYYLYP